MHFLLFLRSLFASFHHSFSLPLAMTPIVTHSVPHHLSSSVYLLLFLLLYAILLFFLMLLFVCLLEPQCPFHTLLHTPFLAPFPVLFHCFLVSLISGMVRQAVSAIQSCAPSPLLPDVGGCGARGNADVGGRLQEQSDAIVIISSSLSSTSSRSSLFPLSQKSSAL